MLAGMLRDSGYYMGDNYIRPRAANPKGFFEDREVNRINDRLIRDHTDRRLLAKAMRRLGFGLPRMGNWLAQLPTPITSSAPREIASRIRERVSHVPFCYKDPRLSYTLPVWEPYLPPNTRYVVVFRDPLRTAASILREAREQPRLRRLSLSLEQACRIWTSVYKSILSLQSPDRLFMFVHFNQIITRSRVDAIESFLGAKVDRDFAESDISRTKNVIARETPQDVREIYKELCILAEAAPHSMELQRQPT